MYKVFIESRQIILSKISEKILTNIRISDSPETRKNLSELIFNSKEDFTITTDDLDSLWSDFQSHFKLIIAAGGIVEKDGKYLFIVRHGKWDIPKGKLEKGEDEKEGAIREIEEECNIHNPKIKKKICDTYHCYELNGKMILKKSIWYYLKYKGEDDLIPQTEEGISEVRWLKKKEFELVRSNTYGSIQEVLDVFEREIL
ncbi:MAG: NUDIX domain-containing protein [Crocinitomicaceae bacterium]|nr:NUDIX domain-containing protein [Crocinitomicaceae bacterium]